MNINLTLPEGSIERLVSALERIASAAERIAGPPLPATEPQPFDRSLWGYSDNATSRQVEQDERREATGYGPDYERAIEYAAFGPPGQPDGQSKG